VEGDPTAKEIIVEYHPGKDEICPEGDYLPTR